MDKPMSEKNNLERVQAAVQFTVHVSELVPSNLTLEERRELIKILAERKLWSALIVNQVRLGVAGLEPILEPPKILMSSSEGLAEDEDRQVKNTTPGERNDSSTVD